MYRSYVGANLFLHSRRWWAIEVLLFNEQYQFRVTRQFNFNMCGTRHGRVGRLDNERQLVTDCDSHL